MTTAHRDQPIARDADTELRLTVIGSSVRDDRVGVAIAAWAATRAEETGATVSVIDLADTHLPDDRLLQPGGGHRSSIANLIDATDGFVIVTPEYNHSYPASLKRAIDWHYGEWMLKTATVISYGVHGGLLATEHLRGVLAELHVVTTRSTVGLPAPWDHVGPAGYDAPARAEDAISKALAELEWWAATLKQARAERPFPR